MTGKFFEYIGAGRPIFALVPEGVLKQSYHQWTFRSGSPQQICPEIAAEFKKVYETWKNKGRLVSLQIQT